MTYRVRNIGIAVALALIAGLMTVFYVSNYKKNVVNAEANVPVYVASQDIPAGTPGADAVKMLEKTDVVRRNVAPGAVSSPSQIEDKVVKDQIFAGEQVTTLRFTTEDARGIRSQITGNQRAYQLPGDQHQLLAGTLKAGDRVDIVGNWSVPESATSHFTRTILRDILVLKAPVSASAQAKVTSGPNASAISATLALTDAQAQKLFWMQKNGDWSLELRPPDDASDSPQTVEKDITLLLDGLKPNQLRAIIAQAQRYLPAERNTSNGQ